MNNSLLVRSSWLRTALLAAAALIALAGCNRPKIVEPKRASPIISEHMVNIQKAMVALARAIDDGDTAGIDDTTGMITDQYLRTRGISPGKRADGTHVDLRKYDLELVAAIQDVRDVRGGMQANRWGMVSTGYGRISASCIDCHNRWVDRPIKLDLPTIRNF